MATWSLLPCRPELKPGALLALVEYLLWDIYSIWLLLEDVCRLDSAICAKWLRPDFLRIISSDLLLFLREEICILGLGELNWIRKKGIHLASLRLPPTHEIDGKEQECICASIASLINSNSIIKLEMIDFNWCTYIKDADLAAILSKSFRSIKIIDIRTNGKKDEDAKPRPV